MKPAKITKTPNFWMTFLKYRHLTRNPFVTSVSSEAKSDWTIRPSQLFMIQYTSGIKTDTESDLDMATGTQLNILTTGSHIQALYPI